MHSQIRQNAGKRREFEEYTQFFLQVNSGSGLAPEEGVFKAPKEGNYYFQFHGLVRKFNKTIRAGGITDGTD